MLAMTISAAAQRNNEGMRPRFNPTEMAGRMADRAAEQFGLDDQKAQLFKVLYIDYSTARQNALNPKGEKEEDENVKMESMTDEQANAQIEKHLAAQEAALKVDREYKDKFLEILTPKQVLQIIRQRTGMQGFAPRQGGQRGGQRMNGRMGGRPDGMRARGENQ